MRVLTLSVVAMLALPLTRANAREPATTAEAEHLEADGAFSRAGEAWEALVQEGDHEAQILAAYRAQKAYRAAAPQEPDELCRAHAVVAAILERDDLTTAERADFEAFRSEVEASAELGELCPQADPPFLPIGVDEIPPDLATDDSPAPTQTRAELRRPRGLQIAGAVLLGAGAGLLGLATYGVVEDYRAAEEILAFIPKNATTGLGQPEMRELRAAQRRAEVGSQIAIGAGVGAGVVVVAGAVFLGVGSRRARRGPDSERPITLTPDVSRDYGGFALRGRF